MDQCQHCKCCRILFNRSDDSHIIQKPIGRRRKIYERSGVKLVNINDTTQTMSVDKDVTMPVSDVQKHLEALWKKEAQREQAGVTKENQKDYQSSNF